MFIYTCRLLSTKYIIPLPLPLFVKQGRVSLLLLGQCEGEPASSCLNIVLVFVVASQLDHVDTDVYEHFSVGNLRVCNGYGSGSIGGCFEFDVISKTDIGRRCISLIDIDIDIY